MSLALSDIILLQEGLDAAAVLVAWGNITGARPDLVAAAGNKVYIFTPSDQGYSLSATINAQADILSMAVGFLDTPAERIVLGLEDKVVVYGIIQGEITRLWETSPEPGAGFVDVVLADLDGDGVAEVIAASEAEEALFVYQRPVPDEGLELLAIRVLPGPAQRLAIVRRSEGVTPLIAAAYRNNASSGIQTLFFTEIGFAEGPSLDNLPALLTALTAGDLRQDEGDEIVWGGDDGVLRVLEVNEQLTTEVTSDNLGGEITALAAGKLPGENFETLIAGTPEGFLFGYQAPVERSAPDWAVRVGRPVSDLDISDEGLLGLGTSDGAVIICCLSAAAKKIHVVRPGETLAKIARLYQTSVTAIAEANRISDPDLILVGRTLVIP